MKGKSVSYHLLHNYILMIVLTTALAILGFAVIISMNSLYDDDSIYVSLTASNLMKDDYTTIDTSRVEHFGGGVQAVNKNFQILFSRGERIFSKDTVSPAEFTERLVHTSMKSEILTIAYNESREFWLIVSLPIAIKADLHIDFGRNYPQYKKTFQMLGKFACGYLAILLFSIFIYSRFTSRFFIEPLKKLCMSVERFKEGNYSARTKVEGSTEFMELQTSLNVMAAEIQNQTEQKELSEENRKKLMMDISHDLKNPLMSITGFAQMIPDETDHKTIEQYSDIILSNGLRANELVEDLFELSQMENPSFKMEYQKLDFTEYLRNEIIQMLPELEKSGLSVEINIPEKQILCNFDPRRMRRVISNLLFNAISYCGGHGEMQIEMEEEETGIVIRLANTVDQEKQTGQTDANEYYHVGLGLTIVKKIVCLHQGSVSIDERSGHAFEIRITLPKA